MSRPETRYARSEGAWIAYEVMGDGPVDLIMMTTIGYTLDSHFDHPSGVAFMERLASFSRLIRYDRRGAGLSDPTDRDDPPTLDQWVMDSVAVLDAVGAERPAIFATDAAGAQVGMLFAATRPERVSSLVLVQPNPCPVRREGVPWGVPEEEVGAFLQRIEDNSVTGEFVMLQEAEGLDEEYRSWIVRSMRTGGSPTVRRNLWSVYMASDLRPLLPSIAAPTLVIQRSGHGSANPGMSPDAARSVADQIPGARLVDVRGGVSFFDVPGLLDEVEEFVTGVRPRSSDDERVFATLLFGDIVGSTERAGELGDRRWRELLDRHDAVVRGELARFGGRWVHSAGDGFLATFDGPARAVRCARSISEAVHPLGIAIRAGLHAGEVEVRGDDVSGIAVNIASRVSDLAEPGQVLVSRTVTDLVAGSGLRFADRGEHTLRGVEGPWRLYALDA